MIQEILGCWWTKSTFLTATKEEILALASDETKLNYLVKNISLILDDDDFSIHHLNLWKTMLSFL